MTNYWCSTCGRHLFSYDQQGLFRIVIKCRRCGVTNNISFGNIFVRTETPYAVIETNTIGIF